MSKDPKSLATSITAQLRNLATNRKAPYSHLLTEFLIERMAARLTAVPILRKHLVFKGGFVSLKIYNSPRYTVDLDVLAEGLSLDSAVDGDR